MRDCLTCKYEPNWGKVFGGDYPRRVGDCKNKIKLPPLPKVYRVSIAVIERYSDDSGVIQNCPAWVKA